MLHPMLDLGAVVGLSGLSQTPADIWTDGDTVYNAEGKLVPKIAIPKGEGEERKRWDAGFRMAQERAFGTNLTPLRVPVDPEVTVNNNPVKNRARYEMYLRMAQAGARLPAIVIRPGGTNARGENKYFVVDGNHRWFAAQAAGLTEIDALLIGQALNAFGGLWRR